MLAAKTNFLRRRGPHEHSRVTYVELFFDLVFVFAITQLSHLLLKHLSLTGAVETAILFVAVWWVWIYTCWFTNWMDPDRTPVRLALLALMLAGLVLSTSLPRAFEDRGAAFAAAVAVMQLGRSAFMLWSVRRHEPRHFRSFRRIIAWHGLSALFWLAGALMEPQARLAAWAVAVLIEFIAPSAGYWTPGFGRSSTADWRDVEGGHMAERCALFVIIALGESILVTGATFADLPPTPAAVGAFASAFVGSVAMWWIYFDAAAERASERFARSDDPGRVARLAYTYLHIPLVAGIVVSAVGDELALAHLAEEAEAKVAAVMLAGPGLYLFGDLLFRRATTERLPRSHLAGLAALAILAPFSHTLSPLALSIAGSGVLTAVALGESLLLRRGRAGTPSAP
jgi:low temperature requirement protein LtrA